MIKRGFFHLLDGDSISDVKTVFSAMADAVADAQNCQIYESENRIIYEVVPVAEVRRSVTFDVKKLRESERE